MPDTRKRPSYSREDVQRHECGGQYLPAVNVKCHLWSGAFTPAVLADVAGDVGEDPDEFAAWWTERDETETRHGTELGDLIDDPDGYGWCYYAAESAFEDARGDALDVFGPGVKVWQEGRSGGWLVVDGLPELDTWDAIMLGKWRRFETMIRAAVEDFPRAVAWLICANVYESHAIEARRIAAVLDAWTPIAGCLVPVAL